MPSAMSVRFLSLLFVVGSLGVEATISENFRRYIEQRFGSAAAKGIARTDFGSAGSFGGGNHQAGSKTRNTPTVFVHGYGQKAVNYEGVARVFKGYGRTDEELYATTYGEEQNPWIAMNPFLAGSPFMIQMMNALLLGSLLLLIPTVHSTISSSFYNFVEQEFGRGTAELIARRDFGARGSYGGGGHTAGEKTKRKPVVFVHGFGTSAATTLSMARQFKAWGYQNSELYATTFGAPAGPIPLQIGMRCQHVKGVRALIKAVAKYTNSKVDVIGYSMGGPVSRKAILGGRCVDTGENLGGPLTKKVNVYLGVAGAQRGARTCGIAAGVCNLVNGMNCRSRFINDINSSSGYEGRKRYVLQSSTDEIVGITNACGQRSSEFRDATKVVTISGLGHIQTCANTARIQYNLLRKGRKN
ncbi:Triacylglycerol lipase [Aphelenchoides fujianensis]|nr:Triacylglycerol lipase [Aphelenchoides fujianensis]